MPMSVKTSATVTERKKTKKNCLLIKNKISLCLCVLLKCFHELLNPCPNETWPGTKGSRCNYIFFKENNNIYIYIF